jgi:hypothetical protein
MPLCWYESKQALNDHEVIVDLLRVVAVQRHESGRGSRLMLDGGGSVDLRDEPQEVKRLMVAAGVMQFQEPVGDAWE